MKNTRYTNATVEFRYLSRDLRAEAPPDVLLLKVQRGEDLVEEVRRLSLARHLLLHPLAELELVALGRGRSGVASITRLRHGVRHWHREGEGVGHGNALCAEEMMIIRTCPNYTRLFIFPHTCAKDVSNNAAANEEIGSVIFGTFKCCIAQTWFMLVFMCV